MAIFKRCNRCHELYEGERCQKCHTKISVAYQRRKLRENENLKRYHSRVWQRCRQEVINKYLGYDIWLMGEGIVRACKPAYIHHIVERDENPDLFLDVDNLIPVSHASHEEIHKWYDGGKREEAIARIEKGKAEFERKFNDS